MSSYLLIIGPFFRLLKNRNDSAADLNHDLDFIKRWAHDWRMSFNLGPAKQAVEVLFSKKKIPVDHPSIFLNDIDVMKVDEHKHPGVALHSQQTFSSYIQSAINRAKRGHGMLRFLSSYLPRYTLNQLYKLYVHPYLGYGGVIHHIQ